MPIIFPHRQMLDNFEMQYGSRANGDEMEVHSAFQTNPALCRFQRGVLDGGAFYELLANWANRYQNFAVPIQVTPTRFYFDMNDPVVEPSHWGSTTHAGDFVFAIGNYGAQSAHTGNYLFMEFPAVFDVGHNMDNVALWAAVAGGVLAQNVVNRVEGTGCIQLTTFAPLDGMVNVLGAPLNLGAVDFFSIWLRCSAAGTIRMRYTDNAARTAVIDLVFNQPNAWERFVYHKNDFTYSSPLFDWTVVTQVEVLDTIGGRVYLVDIHERIQAPAQISPHLNDYSFITTALYIGRQTTGYKPIVIGGLDGQLFVSGYTEHAGNVVIAKADPLLWLRNTGAAGTSIDFYASEGLNEVYRLLAVTDWDQLTFSVTALAGRQFVFCAVGSADYGHDLQVTPTWFVHDELNPNIDNTHWGGIHHAGDMVFSIGNYGAESPYCGDYLFRESMSVFAPDHDMDNVGGWAAVAGGVLAQNVADRVQGTGCISLTTANIGDGMRDAAAVDASGDDFFSIWFRCTLNTGILRILYTDNAARTARIDLTTQTLNCWERFVWNKNDMTYSNIAFSWANITQIDILEQAAGAKTYLIDIHERIKAAAQFSAHTNDWAYIPTALYIGRMTTGAIPLTVTGLDGDVYVGNRLEVVSGAYFQNLINQTNWNFQYIAGNTRWEASGDRALWTTNFIMSAASQYGTQIDAAVNTGGAARTLYAGTYFSAPVVTLAGGTIATAATVYIEGLPTDGTSRWALQVVGTAHLGAAAGTAAANLLIRSTAGSYGQIIFYETFTLGVEIATVYGWDQFYLGLSPPVGNQIVIGSVYADYDHPVQTNQTLFIHSALSPDTNNTRWGCDYHTGTAGAEGAFRIICGAGNIEIYPGGGPDAVVTSVRTAGKGVNHGYLATFAAAYAVGDVVIYNVAVTWGVVTTAVAQNALRAGVVAAVRDAGNVGIVQTVGSVTITRENQVPATVVGDYVYTGTVAGQVQTSNVLVAGAVLGRAQTALAGGAPGAIDVLLEKH